MTVDMLSASFLPPALPALATAPEPSCAAPDRGEEGADEAARAEGFWSAVLRHLWHPADAVALP